MGVRPADDRIDSIDVVRDRRRSGQAWRKQANNSLIQSQFEFPQDYDVKVETDGGEWYAELTVERATLDRQRLVIDGRGPYTWRNTKKVILPPFFGVRLFTATC